MNKLLLALLVAAAGTQLAAQPLEGVYHYKSFCAELAPERMVKKAETKGGTVEFQAGGAMALDGADDAERAWVALGGGAFRFTAPEGDPYSLNARLDGSGDILLAASTEANGLFCMFAAVKRPPSRPELTGTYQAVRLDLNPARAPEARTILGSFDGATANISIDDTGKGTLTDPTFGQISVAVAPGGGFIAGTPLSGDGFFVAVRSGEAPRTQIYWLAELSFEGRAATASIGSFRNDGAGLARLSQRSATLAGPRDHRGVAAFAANPDGTGSLEGTPLRFGYASFVGASPASILVAVRTPAYAGVEPFLHPHGVVDAASIAPPGNPVAPGAFVSLYGQGLALTDPPDTAVTVNGKAASVVFASPGQVNVRLPADLTGETATFTVATGGAASNPVTVRLAPTSPAMFSADYSGTGPGMITHADYSMVAPAAPARRGEIVLLWLTGLGVNKPAPRVLIGGVPAEVL
ncbi:MAG TPA: hypothetical protein ENJ62_05030, partial [Bryobacterales bacterium]|nr:hypothetical protein [Bryobacterales bacterium]